MVGLVVAAIASAGAIGLSRAMTERMADTRRARGAALEAVDTAISLLRDDPTPTAQSLHDPLWQRPPEGVSVTDLSARVSAAVVPPEVVPLGARGATPAVRPRRYAPRELPFFNVNAAPSDLLERIAASRLPASVSSSVVLEPLYRLRREGTLVSPETLRLALGHHYRRLAPVLRAEPLLNANTLPRAQLAGLLGAFSRDGGSAAERVIDARAGVELDATGLTRLLGDSLSQSVLSFIGVRSWGVSLRIEKNGRVFRAVIACVRDEASVGWNAEQAPGFVVTRFLQLADAAEEEQ